MKKQLLILFFLFANLLAYSQNLGPNPSFEDTFACPWSFQIDKVISWSSACGSPDYCHSCATSGDASVPNNFYGYQTAINVNAYV